MGRIIMIGVAIIAALVFLPGLLSGGTSGAKSGGKSATDSIVDTAKDPNAVIDKAGDVTGPVVEVATPWWEWLIAQPWFYAAVLCLGGAWLMRRAWQGMGGTTRLIVVGLGVAVFMLIAVGLNK
ncbi:MAG: hypothetical protein ABW360_03955 [Phenylobacterium sp.]